MAQPILDNLIDALRNVKNPLLGKIFGLQQHFLESDPDFQATILAKSERKVYGSEGIESFERREPSELKRLAKRTLAQYLCQQDELDRSWVKVAWWAGMLVSLPGLVAYLLFRTLKDRSRAIVAEAREADVVIYLKKEKFRPMLCGVFPDKKLYLHTQDAVHLGPKEWSYFFRAMGACPTILLHPKLVANLLRWLSNYGFIVHHFHPKAVAFCFELVASSSLITGFLRENGAKHLNVTHGERVFCAHGGFCEFDEDYVWGQHFAEVGTSLKERSTFVIRGGEAHTELFQRFRGINQPRPKRLLITHNPFLSSSGVDYQVIVSILSLLDASWQVVIRRHPAWDLHFNEYVAGLRRDLPAIQITEEPPSALPLKQALATSRIVVGGSSTALIEAAIAGCKVIYLAGVAHPSTVIHRHQGSENILYATPSTDNETLSRFLSEPAVLTREEDVRVNFLARVSPHLELAPI